MKLASPLSVQEAADFVGATVKGDTSLSITGINEIHKVEPGDLTFVDFHKYYDMALGSAATFILIDKEVDCPKGKALLVIEDPFSAFNKLTQRYRPFRLSSERISPEAEIGEGTVLQPGVFVGNNVTIGKNCIIHANVSICDHTVIGDNVVIQPNTVIGGDAFYFKKRSGEQMFYDKMMSCGRVIIEDNVEIGSSCTIDRGVSGDTIIGKGTKMDNLIHIGHGVVIGKNCLIAAQVGIAGKTTIEDEVIIWGQAGISKDLTVGAKAIISAQSGVSKSLEGGKLYMGAPAVDSHKKWREMAALRSLPKLLDKLKNLNSTED